MFKELKEIISKILKEGIRTMSHQRENINNEIEITIGKKTETLELKKSITETK